MDQDQIEEHAQGYASMVGRLAGCMAGVSSRARLEGMLKALERTRTAITEELDKHEAFDDTTVQAMDLGRCACCGDTTPVADPEFYGAPWCGTCGHPGSVHARDYPAMPGDPPAGPPPAEEPRAEVAAESERSNFRPTSPQDGA